MSKITKGRRKQAKKEKKAAKKARKEDKRLDMLSVPLKSPLRHVDLSSRLMPPLNQSLWALLIASLTAFGGWGVVYLSALLLNASARSATLNEMGTQI